MTIIADMESLWKVFLRQTFQYLFFRLTPFKKDSCIVYIFLCEILRIVFFILRIVFFYFTNCIFYFTNCIFLFYELYFFILRIVFFIL